MIRTYKYRLKVNEQCQTTLINWLDKLRELYNLALEQRIDYWKRGKSITYNAQAGQLAELKKEFKEYKDVGSQVLQITLKRLDRAYQNFFRRCKRGEKPGFPRFKSKDRFNSFTFPGEAGWKLDERNLIIKKVGTVRLIKDRPIQGDIKTVTIKRTLTDKWFVMFSCDNVFVKEYPKTEKEIGLDVGISSFLTDSDGNKVGNGRFLKKSEKVLRRGQRRVSRRKKGSERYKKAKLLVAKVHEHIVNQRLDFLHKVFTDYVRRFKKIVIENLKIENMVRNKQLSKSIYDVSWGKFFELLSYKAEEAGRELIKVDPRNTSQMCSQCGKLVIKTLADRVHFCPYCNLKMDRDENAARNILVKSGWVSLSSVNVACTSASVV